MRTALTIAEVIQAEVVFRDIDHGYSCIWHECYYSLNSPEHNRCYRYYGSHSGILRRVTVFTDIYPMVKIGMVSSG